jgi:hypothetical protein
MPAACKAGICAELLSAGPGQPDISGAQSIHKTIVACEESYPLPQHTVGQAVQVGAHRLRLVYLAQILAEH